MLPAVQQSGLGNFCESGLKLPETWVGSKGLVSIVQDAADGLLYQVGFRFGLVFGVWVLMMSDVVFGGQLRRGRECAFGTLYE